MNILDLELITNHSLQDLANFYTKLLAKSPLEYIDQYLRLQVGTTQLSFKHQKSDRPARYHFAIHIPENQFTNAHAWMGQQVKLIINNEGKDMFYSESWDADSLYFYDPAGNILELIAHHRLDNKSNKIFNAHSLLSVCEIGIAADNVAQQVDALKTQIDVNPYRTSVDPEFTPVGDAQGLFIVVKQGRTWFPNTGIPAEHLPVNVTVEQNGLTKRLTFPSGNVLI
ncbi:MAG: hypothetical protein CL609_03685 [Anaerolineaceae bacterium]|nr:hypothetical protein [Anaerolineaceae bacterium]